MRPVSLRRIAVTGHDLAGGFVADGPERGTSGVPSESDKREVSCQEQGYPDTGGIGLGNHASVQPREDCMGCSCNGLWGSKTQCVADFKGYAGRREILHLLDAEVDAEVLPEVDWCHECSIGTCG